MNIIGFFLFHCVVHLRKKAFEQKEKLLSFFINIFFPPSFTSELS